MDREMPTEGNDKFREQTPQAHLQKQSREIMKRDVDGLHEEMNQSFEYDAEGNLKSSRLTNEDGEIVSTIRYLKGVSKENPDLRIRLILKDDADGKRVFQRRREIHNDSSERVLTETPEFLQVIEYDFEQRAADVYTKKGEGDFTDNFYPEGKYYIEGTDPHHPHLLKGDNGFQVRFVRDSNGLLVSKRLEHELGKKDSRGNELYEVLSEIEFKNTYKSIETPAQRKSNEATLRREQFDYKQSQQEQQKIAEIQKELAMTDAEKGIEQGFKEIGIKQNLGSDSETMARGLMDHLKDLIGKKRRIELKNYADVLSEIERMHEEDMPGIDFDAYLMDENSFYGLNKKQTYILDTLRQARDQFVINKEMLAKKSPTEQRAAQQMQATNYAQKGRKQAQTSFQLEDDAMMKRFGITKEDLQKNRADLVRDAITQERQHNQIGGAKNIGAGEIFQSAEPTSSFDQLRSSDLDKRIAKLKKPKSWWRRLFG